MDELLSEEVISANIYTAIADKRKEFELTYNDTPHRVLVPEWVYKWLKADAQKMGVYIDVEIYEIYEYLGMVVLIDPSIDDLDDILVI